jgi:hypothetical protein
LILAAAAALALGGCGDDEAADPTAEVKAAATEFGLAVLQADGDKACGLMTDSLRKTFDGAIEKIAEALGESTEDGPKSTCVDTIGLYALGLGDPEKRQTQADRNIAALQAGTGFGAITVEGDYATVASMPGFDEPLAFERNEAGWLATVPKDGTTGKAPAP